MVIQIFRNNVEVVQVKPLDSSELSQKKQEEDIIRLNFELVDFVDLKIGDYIGFEKTGQTYILNKNPRITQIPKRNRYECIFEGSVHELKKTKVFLQTPKLGGGFYQDYKFTLTGTAETFLSFIVSNLNRNSSGYTIGTFKNTSTVNVTFNNWNVFEAITELSNLLRFDWYLNGKELHFDQKGLQTAYVLQVGRKMGMTSLVRTRVEQEDIKTIVYGYGSTQNLPPRTASSGLTYDGETLTKNRLAFTGVDNQSKLEKNKDLFGNIEDVKEFDIKPERVGTVSTIETTDVTVFYDASIDFDVEAQKIEGILPKASFLSGTLLGLTFPITFDYSQKKFTLDVFTDESGTYPNTIQNPQVGDSYVLVDIIMPLSYIVDASTKLEAATQTYLDEKSGTLDYYQGFVDEEWVDLYNVVINLGDLLRIVSPQFQIDNLYEVKNLIQNVNNTNLYKIQFGDILPEGRLASLGKLNFQTQQEIFNIQSNTYTTKQTTNQVVNIVGSEIQWEEL